MKTLTLRNIPKDVQEIIEKEKHWRHPATRTLYRLIRKIPILEKKIAEFEALNNDSKKGS